MWLSGMMASAEGMKLAAFYIAEERQQKQKVITARHGFQGFRVSVTEEHSGNLAGFELVSFHAVLKDDALVAFKAYLLAGVIPELDMPSVVRVLVAYIPFAFPASLVSPGVPIHIGVAAFISAKIFVCRVLVKRFVPGFPGLGFSSSLEAVKA